MSQVRYKKDMGYANRKSKLKLKTINFQKVKTTTFNILLI